MAARPAPGSSRRRLVGDGESEPDEIIGDFQRGKEIGKGSFATVYLARHRKRKSYAAVKVVSQGRLSDKLKLNLEGEIQILRDLHHPHIVALFACQETPRHFYLIMEYCQLSDLSQFLKKRESLATLPETADIFRRYPNPTHGGFNEVLSRHFMKQIASALDYLRSQDLLHRDIKPQNLLLNPAPSYMYRQRPEDVPLAASENSLVPAAGVQSLPMLKIADFGFARHLPQTSMAETLCGSPLYMAPEILRYEKYNARADLWSVGTVLYEMVVGKPPFRAPNHVDLLRRIEKTNDNIVFDNRNMVISRGMKDLIRKLLKKSPTERMTYDELLSDPVITDEIPGLVEEDRVMQTGSKTADPDTSELSRRLAKQAINAPTPLSSSPDSTAPAKQFSDVVPASAIRKPSDQDLKKRPTDILRRTSSNGKQNQTDTAPQEMVRRPSQAEHPKLRRPSMTPHLTAPGRQELLAGPSSVPVSAPRMERRPSRTSPLTGPPMVREASNADTDRAREERALRDARERTAQDMAFEKEYVMVEKRAVEINAFADELDATRGSPSRAMIRRASTQGQPPIPAGVQPSSPSRAMQMVVGRPTTTHQRIGSFERRYAPGPQSATNMLTKALNAANVRLFGALGTSPPFGLGGNSPPRGYTAFPVYPSPPSALLLGEGNESKTPVDEDTKIVRIMEDAAHRSDVIFGFAEVKYKQLLPATPSAPDALGIQQIGAQERALTASGEDDDKDMTTVALVGVAEEALVLYVKTLAILAKTIDLAGYWWNQQSRSNIASGDPARRPPGGNTVEVGKRMNSVVQWARNRFNECLEKSEVVGRRLQAAQWQLPEDHPGHPGNHTAASTLAPGGVTTSAEHIHLCSGVTAEKLMFDRAVEMSRASAVAELVGDDLQDCEIGYVTSIMLLEAVLESDDEPLMRKSGAKKDKPADQVINGMETEDRQTVLKLIEGARSRLGALRKKMHAARSARRSSHSGSGHSTPKSTSASPVITPALTGTPPR
ncbi:kinase-like domain-containing protein [Neohortaea acidophila]|uniref:non-specific serine/threonine protein kinase n=1 Tax=Neohortaea acidophila TaxID=245834 RepID=A0A6A6PM07_9PEZI|nr:kinase-like domain-containing protein [Neohortaea acidophila]KAF2480694.1 kinase-like domain-containing protein [Neohortaea acidophila]